MKKTALLYLIPASILLLSCDEPNVRSGVIAEGIPDPNVNPFDDGPLPEPFVADDPDVFSDTVTSKYTPDRSWKLKGQYRAEYDYIGSNSDWLDFALAVTDDGKFRIETENIRVVCDGEEIILVNLFDNSFALFPAPPSPTGQSIALHAPPVLGMYRFLPALEPWMAGLSEKDFLWSPIDSAYEFRSTNGDTVMATVNEEGLISKVVIRENARFVFALENQSVEDFPGDDLFTIVKPETGTEITEQLQLQRNLDEQYAVIGKEAYDFKAPYIDGFEIKGTESLQLSDHKGKVVLIDFWAMWCPPCLEGLPALDRFYQEIDQENIVVIAANLDTDEDIAERTIPWLKKKNISIPNVKIFGADWFDEYGIGPLPYMVLIGPDGIIADVFVGSPPDKSALKKQINDLLNG